MMWSVDDELLADAAATGQATAQAAEGDQGQERCRPDEGRDGQGQWRRGQVLVTPQEGAEAILKLLVEEGVVR
jgi:hypothetical protein